MELGIIQKLTYKEEKMNPDELVIRISVKNKNKWAISYEDRGCYEIWKGAHYASKFDGFDTEEECHKWMIAYKIGFREGRKERSREFNYLLEDS